MMTKCKLGHANTLLCKLIFGGNAFRWSFGYLWILKYLNKRYDRTISCNKLRDYVDDFSIFYKAINHFIKKTSLRHFHDGTAVERQGLSFLPWSIFGFIDCSINRINRPMLGPHGDYDGAPCKALGWCRGQSTLAIKNVKDWRWSQCFYPIASAPFLDLHRPVSMTPTVCCRLQMSGLDAFCWRYSRVSQRYTGHLVTVPIMPNIFSVFD